MSRATSSKRNFERSGPSFSPIPVELTMSAKSTETTRRSPVITAMGLMLREAGERPATSLSPTRRGPRAPSVSAPCLRAGGLQAMSSADVLRRRLRGLYSWFRMSRTKPRRRRGYTRLSSKRQVTIPIAVLAETRLGPGDELRVDVDEQGRIVLSPSESLAERRRRAIEETAGSLAGVYAPGSLDA